MLLSPGAGKSRTTLTTIAEHLASKGYVVAGIDHAFEAYNVEFPGGRLLQCLGCQAAGQPWPQALQNRVTDVSFVLNAVLRDRSLRVDATRIAMAGHTAGGGAAALAMVTDDRIKAGISLDGPIYRPITLGKSLALLTSPIGEQQFGAGWDATWPGADRLDGTQAPARDRALVVHRQRLPDRPTGAEGQGAPGHLAEAVRHRRPGRGHAVLPRLRDRFPSGQALNQPGLVRDYRRLHPVLHVEPAEDRAHVRLDRPLDDEEPGRDIRVRHTGFQQRQHFLLLRRERREEFPGRGATAERATGQLRDHAFGHLRGQERGPVRDRPYPASSSSGSPDFSRKPLAPRDNARSM